MSSGSIEKGAEISRLLEKAYRCHEAGNWRDAECSYLELLELDPGNAQALYLLGSGKAQNNDPAAAVALFKQAIDNGAEGAGVRVNLGTALLQSGQTVEADAIFRQAVTDYPDCADAWFGLGRVSGARQDYVGAQNCFSRALACRPGYAQASYQLGLALFRQGRLVEAAESYRDAVRQNPQLVHVYSELGKVLQKLGRPEEAVAAYRQYISARPDAADGWNNLGLVQRQLAQMDAAAESCRRALQINPEQAQTWNNLGNILKMFGRLDEAAAHYRRAVELAPAFVQAHSNLLLCLDYDPRIDEQTIYHEHLRWVAAHIPATRGRGVHRNDPDPERRLRIGYVSPDLREHAVARLFEPLLANHDKEQVTVTCYAQLLRGDAMTRRLQACADRWRCTVGVPDTELAAQIRDDGIDVLVDLAGHTARNRLPVFALRPAPIQISWLGYPNTTGMQAIDYYLTDQIADPAGADDLYTEQLLRLETGLSCYAPPVNAPFPGPLPSRDTPGVTFGSLNNLVKLNRDVVDLWCRILKKVPHSRLLLYRDMLTGGIAKRVRDEFARHGITGGRLELLHECDPETSYLGTYRGIDIALDPFPWNGHVTTCEALWMGVPVVALKGLAHRGRLAASVLYHAGLNELVADDKEEYVRIAAELAKDRTRLARYRQQLRAQLTGSDLCNGARLAREVESVYRNVWRCWCADNG